MVLVFAMPVYVGAEDAEPAADGHADMGAVGAKLANPLSDLWSLQFNYQALQFSDGDLNQGDSEVGSTLVFQPVLPIPLSGEGDSAWRMITRPVIPLIFSTPVPEGFNDFDSTSGIGDIQLPFLLAVPGSIVGKWVVGGGPVFEFPSATDSDLGSEQWSMGPAIVVGHRGENLTAILFPNYFWKIGESGQNAGVADVSKGTLLYSLTYKLADGWQVGTNPTISYNNKASSGNKWNVPVGPFIGRTVRVGNTPLNVKLGIEYSVVRQDDFGQEAAIRLVVTPVVPSLMKNPIFGN